MTPKNYNRFFLTVLSRAKSAHAKQDCVGAAIRGELTRSSGATTAWPTNKQFKDGWKWKYLYVRSRPDRSAMILKAIQSEMRTNKNEQLKLIGSLSVEHLLPQNGKLEDYPYADTELDDDYSQEQYRTDTLHTVGNLTLLTGPLNSSASNGPFPEKVVKICEDSDLRLNAWLRKDPPKNWDELSIEKRSEELFKIAKKIWPAPTEI